MERDQSHNHRWNIDMEGKGICLHCGEVKQFPTPLTVGNYLSKRQITKGVAEAEKYNKLQNLLLV